MSHNTHARDTIIWLARQLRDQSPHWFSPHHLTRIIEAAESMTLDDPPTYDAEPVDDPPFVAPPRLQMRAGMLRLVELAEDLGWGYQLESTSAGKARTYELTVWEPYPATTDGER